MSYTEYVTGKIKEIKPNGKQTLEELCEIEFLKYNIQFDEEFYPTFKDALLDEHCEKYFIDNKNRLFIYLEYTSVDINTANISNVVINLEDEIDFEVLFYNGGASLSEAIQYAMTKNKI